ncbi:MAG: SDR family oxidoreductase, partial [Zoogloea sp.]|nr:SDR family oxidoreductase [Zoogloea sp.]
MQIQTQRIHLFPSSKKQSATPGECLHRRARPGLALCAGLAWLGATEAAGPAVREPILPVPAAPKPDPRRVALGDLLFHDARLSGNDTVSCASCHSLAAGGTDNLRYSRGVKGALGTINAPTVFNSGLNFVQFWDGRSATLEDQVEGPVNNPLEMASNWRQVLDKLRQDRPLVDAFRAAYPGGLSAASIRDAIASFERTLVTENAPFDRYLRGDHNALSPGAQRGYRWFKAYAVSKLMILQFTAWLAREAATRGIKANAVHPGVVRTSIMFTGKWYDAIIRLML